MIKNFLIISIVFFGFESASDKVLNDDIQKGQTQLHLKKTVDALHQNDMTPLTTFMIGNPHEDINDIMETLTFWIENNLEVDPFICTPYVGSPLFYNNKDFILSQYDERLKIVGQTKTSVKDYEIKKWNMF